MNSFARAVAPLTVGAGLEEIILLARLRSRPGAEPREVALRLRQPAGGRDRRDGDRAPDRAACARSTSTPRRSGARRRAAPSTRSRSSRCCRARVAPSSSTTWTAGRLVPGRPAAGQQRAGDRGRCRVDADRFATLRAWCGSPCSVTPPRRWVGRRAGVLAGDRGARPGRGAWASRSSGSRCRLARRSRWAAAPRTWTGWPGRCAG